MSGISNKRLGARIREAREKMKLSQFQLYEKTGISTTQISAYENGKKNVGLNTLAKIASALNLSLDELYYGTASHKPISTAMDTGELIVNCVLALYEQHVISVSLRTKQNKYVPMGMESFYQISLWAYVDILNDLVLKLEDFKRNKQNYPDPEGFKRQLLAAAVKQINTCIDENEQPEKTAQ